MDRVLHSFSSCLASLDLPYVWKLLEVAVPWRETSFTLGSRQLVVLQLIGEGGYSFVYKVSERTPSGTTRHYALKKVLVATGEQLATARQEVDVMHRLHHPNLLPLLDSAVTHLDEPDNPSQFAIHMLFPLYDQGSVMDQVMQQHQTGKALPPQTILSIFIQVCRGVHAMHSAEPQPLAHRDIKPHNVLLRTERHGERSDAELNTENVPLKDERGHGNGIHAVLMDFGSTRPARLEVNNRAQALSLQEDAEAHCSAPYRAPELFDVPSQCTIDERVDVWSLGCLLYFMMYAVSPFEQVLDQTGGSLALAVANGTVQWPAEDGWSGSLRQIVLYCLNLDPQRRPSVEMVLSRAQAALKECR